MDPITATEPELAAWIFDTGKVPILDPEVPIKRWKREVRVGAHRFDLLALNGEGGLTIVEFKVNASMTGPGQLFIYPTALERVLGKAAPPIRVLLVTTFLDQGVVNMVNRVQPPWPVVFRIVVPDGPDGPQLVGLDDDRCYDDRYHHPQVWEQALDEPPVKRRSQIAWKDGALKVKGETWELGRSIR